MAETSAVRDVMCNDNGGAGLRSLNFIVNKDRIRLYYLKAIH